MPRHYFAQASDLQWRSALREQKLWLAVSVSVFLLSSALPPLRFFAEPSQYLPLHLTLEFFSMAVSAMVFALAWNLRSQPENSHTVLLGSSFLLVCLLDGAHALSYPGMPDLLTASGAGKAINFWLLARVVGGLALLAVAFLPLRSWSKWQSWATMLASGFLSSIAIAAGLLHPEWFPDTYSEGSGLTPFKVGAEYVLVALYALAGGVLFQRGRSTLQPHFAWLAVAAWSQALSEVYLTWYGDVTDIFNVMGHLYKVVAFVLVYRALVVTGVRAPLRALEVERARLRSVLATIPDLVWLKDTHGIYLACNTAFERFFGAPERDIIGKTDYDFVPAELADMFLKNDQIALASAGPVVNEEHLDFKQGGRSGVFETTKTAMLDSRGEILGVLGVAHDITDRKKIEEQLQISSSVFSHAREGIMLTNAQGDILDVNASFTRITGYERAEVIGKNPRILSSGRQSKDYYASMWSALVGDGHWTSEVWNRRKSGEVFAELQTISAVRDANGQIQQYVSLFSDISAFKEHEVKLEHIAHYDALTNLPNRVLFADRLHQAISQRRGGHNVAVVFLDLDGFKAINDQHGHEAGDVFLVHLASRLGETLREGDTLARMGGDEFVAVLSGLSGVPDCVPMLNRLLSVASQPIMVAKHVLQVSASMGVTFYPQDEEVDGEQLLRQADQAMYQAKLAGKNRFQIFDALHDRTVRDLHESLQQFRLAMQGNEFVLYYQPQVNMRTGAVVGFEALIRWQHPQRGLLAPGQFLPAIENQPIAVELGEWVIRAALTQLRAWGALGLEFPVSVNVGARQLQQADFVERLTLLLQDFADVPTPQLKLEVLETSALEDVAGASQVIEDCRRMGITFALDDFGTGYSSLTYLKRLPVKLLKIDQSFVRGMLTDSDDLAILTGVISLANAFRRDVIAEGVETIAHGTMLLGLGCHLGQGYGIARPMPANAVPHWVETWRPDPAWVQATE